ncbi:Chromate resistance protein ChrB [Arthrobacter sp. BPSS-3]|uniref:Chromate resistance protein ChrB n=1 Tax=Arthrobacter sp. BPSS-3 TaxID=3366580 RepID=UPI0037DC19C4
MMWLIVIVQLARAAPRQRRRVSGELAAAGAVGISEGVWAVPDTRFHRTVVAACMRRATNAGGDIIIMNTSPENSPTHDVLETALTERLRSEAAGLALRWKAFTATHRPDISEPLDQTEWHKALSRLQLEATRLSKKDVIGLKEVGSVVKRITGPDMPPARVVRIHRQRPAGELTVHFPDLTAPTAQHSTQGPVLCSSQ